MSEIITAAKALSDGGIAAIAVGEDKRPAASWREYQVRVPNHAEIERTMKDTSALAIVAGKVLCIDVDEKVDPTKTIFARYKARCEEVGLGELWARTVIQRTKNGGYHVVFKCDDESVRNVKLAQKAPVGTKRECLIETRGTGGYFVAYPSPGYTMVQGDFSTLDTFTAEERDALLDAARSLSEEAPVEAAPAKSAPASVSPRVGGELTPGDDFDIRGDMPDLLRSHDWHQIRASKLWTRPGKKTGISASWDHVPGRFYVFTSSTSFEPMHVYRPWHVFAHLECGGDFAEAARKLRLLGYGSKTERREYSGARLGPEADQHIPAAEGSSPESSIESLRRAQQKPTRELPQILAFDDEELSDWPRPPELIHGLLYQGAKGMLAGPSKARKTFLLTDLAVSVASGTPWLGYATTKKPVLYLNLELQGFAYRDRRRAICEAKLADPRVPGLYSMHGRGHSLSWDDLFVKLPEFAKKVGLGLLIVDPVYKLNQGSGDENKAADVGKWLNGLESLATETGMAIVFAHHFAKGDASSKASIDRMSGSGVWARDPDALISFTPHKEEDCMTVEASLRNFAPQPPFVVRWNHPIWERDITLNAGELKDSGNKGGRPGMDLQLFLRALEKHGGTLTRANQDEIAETMACSPATLWRAWKKLKETTNAK